MIDSSNIQARRDRVLERLRTLESLPSLPRVVTDMLRLLAEDDYSMSQLMQLVQQDTGLTARVLKLANSALYGRPRQIESLQQAMVVLGARELQQLVATISVMRTFEDGFQPDHMLDKERFWSHSLGTGELATRVAGYFNLDFKGVDFTAGLLHDVGKVVLDQYFHAEYRDASDLSVSRGLPQFEAERKVLGVDHAEIGSILAAQWGLPESLRAVIEEHHQFREKSPHAPLVACVRIANQLTKEESMACLGEDNLWGVELDPAWNVLVEEQQRVQNERKTEALKEIRQEITRARERVQTMVSELS